VISCQTTVLLELRLDEVNGIFAKAGEKLLERVAFCSRAEFLALSDEVDRACDLVSRARSALDTHIRNHCCLVDGGAAVVDEK
jgi:hypothetical protein